MAEKAANKKEPEPSADNYEYLGKLSVAKIIGKLEKPAKQVSLFVVLGIAHGYKTGTSNYGEWLAFTGNFEVIRSSDQKRFAGGKIFLPTAIQEPLLMALKADPETGEIPEVQFALEIGYKPATNPIGYEYTVRPLVKPGGVDPLAQLREVALPQLAAPK